MLTGAQQKPRREVLGQARVTEIKGPGLRYFPRHLLIGKRLNMLEFLLPLV